MDILVVMSMASALSGLAHGPVSFNGLPLGQDFNTLISSGGAPWSNDATLPGWSLFRQPAPGTPATTYSANSGNNTAGFFYSYGSTGSSERALGGVGINGPYFGNPADGDVAGWIAVALTNNTAATMTDLTIGFDGEQWRRSAAGAAQTMVLEYGYGATFTAVAAWTAPGGSFDWTSPLFNSTSSAIDGNTAGLVAGRGGTLTGQAWLPGDTLWVRWTERNDIGNDHGLALDNFTFTATPTPGAAALLALGGLMLNRRRRTT